MSADTTITVSERVAREREFHDNRFHDGDNRESQKKYYAALDVCFADYARRIDALAKDGDCLDYGCGEGDGGLEVANIAKSVTGIDISHEAIKTANSRLNRTKGQARFLVDDAHAMSFKDGSFDLVYGAGILHHLDYDRALAEIGRVVRPGGAILFSEPLGHNPLINLYRKLTPAARSADEAPLTRNQVLAFARKFDARHIRFYGLATLAAVPFRKTPVYKPIRTVLDAIDAVLLRLPGVKWLAWFVILEGHRPTTKTKA